MKTISTIFFGSTTDSLIVLNTLYNLQTTTYKLAIVAIVTQPPRPIGRKQIVTPTPVEVWSKEHAIPVLSFPSDPEKPSFYASEQTVIDTLSPFQADLLVSASYGQKIPTKTITDAHFGGLNVHPSLLPRWRGADPVPRAILAGDHQTGATVVTLSEQFDEGHIIAQKKVFLHGNETSDPLREQLFTVGAALLADVLPRYLDGSEKGHPQGASDQPTSKRFTRDDGFETWETIQQAKHDAVIAKRLEAKYRAFHPWPGLWTKIKVSSIKYHVSTEEGLRLKIIACHLSHDSCLIIDSVQLEGKQPVAYEQFMSAYFAPTSPAGRR